MKRTKGYPVHRDYLQPSSDRLVDAASVLLNQSSLTIAEMQDRWSVSRHFLNQLKNHLNLLLDSKDFLFFHQTKRRPKLVNP